MVKQFSRIFTPFLSAVYFKFANTPKLLGHPNFEKPKKKNHTFNPNGSYHLMNQKLPPVLNNIRHFSTIPDKEEPSELVPKKYSAFNALYTHGMVELIKKASKEDTQRMLDNKLSKQEKTEFIDKVMDFIKMNIIPNKFLTAEAEKEYKTRVFLALKAGLRLIRKGVINIDGASEATVMREVFYKILRICDKQHKLHTAEYADVSNRVDSRLVGKGLSRDLHDPMALEWIYDHFNSQPKRVADWKAKGFPFNSYDISRNYYQSKLDAGESASRGNKEVDKKNEAEWEDDLLKEMDMLGKGLQSGRGLQDDPHHFSKLDDALGKVLEDWYKKGAHSSKPFNVFAAITNSEVSGEPDNAPSTPKLH